MRRRERDGQLDQRQPGLLGKLSQLLDGVELALVVRVGQVEALGEPAGPRGLLLAGVLAPAARQPAAGERAVGHDGHAVAGAGGQHVGLDPAHEDGVGRLLGHEALEVAVSSGDLGLDDLARREGRGADVADLALPHQIRERGQGLLDVGAGVGAVHLVEVDPVGAQPAQRVLDRAHDPAAGVAAAVRVLAHRVVELGGEHDVVAAAREGLADDLLGLPGAVDVGGVDEVDAGVERRVDDPDRLVVVRVAPRPEHHGAEAELADRDAGASQRALLHICSILSPGRAGPARAAASIHAPTPARGLSAQLLADRDWVCAAAVAERASSPDLSRGQRLGRGPLPQVWSTRVCEPRARGGTVALGGRVSGPPDRGTP